MSPAKSKKTIPLSTHMEQHLTKTYSIGQRNVNEYVTS